MPFAEAKGALPYWDAHRDRVLKLVERDHGAIDILVNNAGHTVKTPFLDATSRSSTA